MFLYVQQIILMEVQMVPFSPIAAVGSGATYIEKHLTIDRNLKLEDYLESALNPGNFKILYRYLNSLDKTFSYFPKWSLSRQTYRGKMVKRPISLNDVNPENKVNF